MAEVIYWLTGTEEAKHCLEAAQMAETEADERDWMRLHRRYMRKHEREPADPSFGDDEFGEMLQAHVGA